MHSFTRKGLLNHTNDGGHRAVGVGAVGCYVQPPADLREAVFHLADAPVVPVCPARKR